MPELSLFSQISLYLILILIGLLTLFIWDWQIMILKGKAIKNPDGSTDDWQEQKTHYGIAFADAFLACPVSIAGIILVLIGSRWEILSASFSQFLACLG